jgi:hypothetical protein
LPESAECIAYAAGTVGTDGDGFRTTGDIDHAILRP